MYRQRIAFRPHKMTRETRSVKGLQSTQYALSMLPPHSMLDAPDTPSSRIHCSACASSGTQLLRLVCTASSSCSPLCRISSTACPRRVRASVLAFCGANPNLHAANAQRRLCPFDSVSALHTAVAKAPNALDRPLRFESGGAYSLARHSHSAVRETPALLSRQHHGAMETSASLPAFSAASARQRMAPRPAIFSASVPHTFVGLRPLLCASLIMRTRKCFPSSKVAEKRRSMPTNQLRGSGTARARWLTRKNALSQF